MHVEFGLNKHSNMIKLENPTKEDLTVTIKGKDYKLKAESVADFEDEVAIYWTTELHTFLNVVGGKTKKEVKKIENETEESEHTEEEVLDLKSDTEEGATEEATTDDTVTKTKKK
jgi:gas vesicle protein